MNRGRGREGDATIKYLVIIGLLPTFNLPTYLYTLTLSFQNLSREGLGMRLRQGLGMRLRQGLGMRLRQGLGMRLRQTHRWRYSLPFLAGVACFFAPSPVSRAANDFGFPVPWPPGPGGVTPVF